MRIVFAAFAVMHILGCTDSESPYEDMQAGNYHLIATPQEGIGGFVFARRGTLETIIQVLDRDMDGEPDEIIYTSLPVDDERVRVHDYQFDGQADERSRHDGSTEIWYRGHWIRVTDADGSLSIVYEGKMVPVRRGIYGHLVADDA